jgi:hypothetical protein
VVAAAAVMLGGEMQAAGQGQGQGQEQGQGDGRSAELLRARRDIAVRGSGRSKFVDKIVGPLLAIHPPPFGCFSRLRPQHFWPLLSLRAAGFTRSSALRNPSYNDFSALLV